MCQGRATARQGHSIDRAAWGMGPGSRGASGALCWVQLPIVELYQRLPNLLKPATVLSELNVREVLQRFSQEHSLTWPVWRARAMAVTRLQDPR